MTSILKDSDIKTFDELKVTQLEVDGDVLIGDDHFIRFGDSQNPSDMKIGHDPNINFIDHNLQLQFRSSMSSGDSYKFFETGRRTSTYLYASLNDGGSEKANYYLTFGNDDTGATNRSFLFEKIRKLDGSGLHTIIEKTQPGNTVDTALIDTKCKAKFSNDVRISDTYSLYFGDSDDLRLRHVGDNSYLEDTGSGSLFVRTNGPKIEFNGALSSTNTMAVFNQNGSCDLYHNNSLKLSTTATGVLVEGITVGSTNTNSAGAGFSDTVTLLTTKIALVNQTKITRILIDIQDLYSSTNSGGAIGGNGASAVNFLRIDKDIHGIVYKVEMICLETPTGGISDIDFLAASNQTDHAASPSGGVTTILNGGTFAIGRRMETASGITFTNGLDDDYLYLTAGTGGNANQYTAGKFLIKIYGIVDF